MNSVDIKSKSEEILKTFTEDQVRDYVLHCIASYANELLKHYPFSFSVRKTILAEYQLAVTNLVFTDISSEILDL